MLRALAAEFDRAGALETLRRARPLINPLAGIVGGLIEAPPLPGEAAVACVAAVGTDAGRTALPGSDISYRLATGGGGVGPDQAAARALGEALERYAACCVDPAGLRLATWREVGGPHPARYELFAPEQWEAGLPYARFDEDTAIDWVLGEDLKAGIPVWVPAKRVYLAPPPGGWKAEIGPAVSTGLACARDSGTALLAGLLEVIERDAFALTWWRRLPTSPVRLPSGGPLAGLIADRFERTGLSFAVRLLPTDLGAHVILVLVLDPGAESSVAAVGAAAHLNPASALLKAMLEAVQTRAWLRQMGGGAAFDPGPSFENVHRFSDHVKCYGRPEALAYLDFLVHTSGPEVALADLPDLSRSVQEDLAYCLDRVAEQDLAALAVDLTPPDLAGCDFVAVRVLVPGALDIAPSHHHRFLGSRRLWDVPVRLGLSAEADLNPYPHPFP